MTYWSHIDIQAFLSIPPPLRPAAGDLETYARLSTRWQGSGRAPRLLVMGCTPDFWDLPLPEGASRMAVDRSLVMLEQLWPGGLAHGKHANWSNLPMADASQDLVFCDGGFTLQVYPRGHIDIASEIARVLCPGGLLVMRMHLQTKPRENPETVLEQFLAGCISNSSELKLRLAAALCEDPRSGVTLNQVWEFFHRAVRGVDDLPRASGWCQADIDRMHSYAGCMDRYTFPSLEEQIGIFESTSGALTLIALEQPIESQCYGSPILAWQRT